MFAIEKLRDALKPLEQGGTNKFILSANIQNDDLEMSRDPLYTFKDNIETFVDLLKRYVFKLHFWVSLSIIFLASTYTITVFSIVYIYYVFVFWWLGTDLYLEPLKVIIKSWNKVLMCNVGTIIIKIFILVIVCTNYPEYPELTRICIKITLTYDIIIFTTIILQRRIFLSYYFLNVINETKTIYVLASRGAAMIEELRLQV